MRRVLAGMGGKAGGMVNGRGEVEIGEGRRIQRWRAGEGRLRDPEGHMPCARGHMQ